MRSKEPETRVYFVRHGKTDFPTDRIYCDDREDPALNSLGVRPAAAAASYFEDLKVDRIVVSPARRTMQTAEAIAATTGTRIETDERLRERRFGVWEGLYFDEIESRFPDEYARWKADPVSYTPAKGETIVDLNRRLFAAISQISQERKGCSIVVVSHVGPIRACVTHAFDIPLVQYRQIRIDYASITTIDYGVSKNNLINLNIVRYS